MPYSAGQLTTYYTTLSGGAAPSAATTSAINTAAAQDAAGTITDAQAFAVASSMSAQVRGTTDVAVASYAFFTGATPSQAGINYLVNNPGTGYNTTFYNGSGGGTPAAPGPGGLDVENRYFNAAVNLGATPGSAGYASFNSTYGGLTIQQAISAEYAAIIGSTVGSTATQAAVASITGALPYFQSLAAQRLPTGGSVDLTTKAIIAGYILEEGIKADVGVYAQALDGFNAAYAMGVGVFNTNLLNTFGAGGSAFNAALQPLANGQTLTSSASNLSTVGVVANGQATVNATSGSTITFTGDIAVNTGQLTVAEGAGSSLNLVFNGQITSTAPSVIAPGASTATVTANTNAAGAVLSLDLEDSSLTTLTIRGGESVAYSAPLYAFTDGTFSFGALTSVNASGATAPVIIDVSSAPPPGSPSPTAGAITVTGTPGADTFALRNSATLVSGGGADTVMLSQVSSAQALSVIIDDHAGVIVGFTGLRAATFNATAVTATSVQNGLDQAAAQGPGVVSYFQFGGDTYLVADNSTATTFQFGNDFAIRLAGVHALAGSTLNGLGQVVLGG